MAGQRTVGASEPIVYIDHSDIREGSLEELKAGVRRLVDLIDSREPQLITYGFYIDEAAAKMTVVAVHPDPASLELHLDIGITEFRKLAHLLTLTAIECYGRPSERTLGQLRHKAATLGDGGAVVSSDDSRGSRTSHPRRPERPAVLMQERKSGRGVWLEPRCTSRSAEAMMARNNGSN
jgi:hypothetical protein